MISLCIQYVPFEYTKPSEYMKSIFVEDCTGGTIIENAPGLYGLYPCYSLVEDTETS
jgi:hypothetical protein